MIRDDLEHVFSLFSVRHVMISLPRRAVRPSVRWDGTRILFEIADGNERVACAISQAALEDLSERRHFGGAAFVECFMAARERIEAIARSKLRAMPAGASGTLNIWASNLDDLPPSSTPMEARRTVQRLSA